MVWELQGVPAEGDWNELWLKLQRLETNLRYLNNYDTFTPTWTAPTTDPAIGNGTLEGWIMQTNDFRIVSIRIVMGSTTTFGSGG